MSYTPTQHQQNRVSAMYGYPAAGGVSLDEFLLGDGIIVMTSKGEPILTGQVEQFSEMPTEEGGIERASVQVSGNWYPCSDYSFRRL